MRVVQIVFSPTGGTQKVADRLTDALGQRAACVDLSDPKADFAAVELEAGDLAVIAVPSFGGRVPALAAQRLGEIRGNGALAVAVCVYGNRAYEDTLIELGDVAGRCGFRLVAGVTAVAEHSIMHQYAAGRPDDRDGEALDRFGRQILEKLNGGTEAPAVPQLPGNRPYKKAGGGGMVPKGDKTCVSCGLCALACPAQAIDPASPRETDSRKCISCMRCVVRCPQSARKVNGAMVAAAALAMKKVCSVRKEPELFL